MDKRTEITNALKQSLKDKNKVAMGTIRLMIAAMKDRDIEARSKGNAEGITEPEILAMLQSMIKQRQESHKTYAEAGREDLARREEEEIEIILGFMPKQMDDVEMKVAVDGLVTEMDVSDIRDMGKLMAELKNRYAGQLDMAKAGALVRQRLAS
jgi:uncharacterized protein YqeY